MSVKHSDMTHHQDCQTIFKARAYRWVQADGVNALSQMIAVLSLFLLSPRDYVLVFLRCLLNCIFYFYAKLC